jgi:4'-phosphopantetheinyl transferase EntD
VRSWLEEPRNPQSLLSAYFGDKISAACALGGSTQADMSHATERTPSSEIDVRAGVLTHLLSRRLPAGAVAAVAEITPEHQDCLTATEVASLSRSAASTRPASGAARQIARVLCGRLGVEVRDIPRLRHGPPFFPAELVGSLAHDATFAAAAIGRSVEFGGIGIDVERPRHLPLHVAELIGSRSERRQFDAIPFGDIALFSIKEAVFKSVCGIDRCLLEFGHVNANVCTQTAITVHGRTVNWRLVTDPWIAAIAWWPR